MTYGLSPYGLSSYGGGVADLTIVNARVISTNVIRVTFSKEPQNILRSLAGDVLNPATWSVVRNDTGMGFNILQITAFDKPLVWDVRVLEPLASVNITHTISAIPLLDASGSPIDTPRSADFRGTTDILISTPDRKSSRRGLAVRDVNNPPFPSELSAGGTLIIDNSGDYGLHEGKDLIRKLIIRRLSTQKDGFSALGLVDYGVGLRVKEPLPEGDIAKFQAELERQVLMEPEIGEARVTVSQSSNAIIIKVNAVIRSTGQNVSFALPTNFAEP